MEKAEAKIKYVIYCRKSTEDPERQVISIESQERELLAYAEKNKLQVYGVFKETGSAHKRGRPIFNQILDLFEDGKANAWLVWQPNRIARNTADGGTVISLMDERKIAELRTPEKTFVNSPDDKFILLLEFGMAKKYSDDMIVSVHRGLKTKVLAGWRPGPAPLGYLNDLTKSKGLRDLIPDSQRFDLVRKIFDLYLEGYSVRKIRLETIKWGLKTRQGPRQGGKDLQISGIYHILTSAFYCGWFRYQGETHRGSHVLMITEDEFDRVQIRLGNKGNPRPRTHFFPYTGEIKCDECGGMITAETKHQLICPACKLKFAYKNKDRCPGCEIDIAEMENPKILEYTYYHCTKKKGIKCYQKWILKDDLQKLIFKESKRFQFSKVFVDWALETLAETNQGEAKTQNAIIENQQVSYKKCVQQLQNLLQLFTAADNLDGRLISKEEYEKQRGILLAEKARLEELQNDTGQRVEEFMDMAENAFNYAKTASFWLENGTTEQRKAVFGAFGSNLLLKDQKLRVVLDKRLAYFEGIIKRVPKTSYRFEPKNNEAGKRKILPFREDIPTLRGC